MIDRAKRGDALDSLFVILEKFLDENGNLNHWNGSEFGKAAIGNSLIVAIRDTAIDLGIDVEERLRAMLAAAVHSRRWMKAKTQ